MADTTRLALPLIEADQALKHITHNEALVRLDGLIQLAVEECGLTVPPEVPAVGEMYDVGTSATGDWSGHDEELALWTEGGWRYVTPQDGWLLWDKDESVLLVRSGGTWTGYNPEFVEFQNLPLVGIHTTADSTNRLAVASDAALFSHDVSGTGDMRVKVNKVDEAATASHLFQCDFDGCAEFGLLGDNDFHIKVSPDNFSSSFEALVAASDSGRITAPLGLTVSPAANLMVGAVDTGNASAEGFRIDGAGVPRVEFQTESSVSDGAVILRYYHGTNEEFRIRGDGDVENRNNSYGAISDARLKQDISDAQSQWQDIKAVRLRQYRLATSARRDPGAPRQLGVIAQEIAETSPGLVRMSEDNGMLSVKYSVLYLKAIGALQEAMTRIEKLEQKLAVQD